MFEESPEGDPDLQAPKGSMAIRYQPGCQLWTLDKHRQASKRLCGTSSWDTTRDDLACSDTLSVSPHILRPTKNSASIVPPHQAAVYPPMAPM